MSDEPDNMVLALLRDIRSTLRDHSGELSQIGQRVDRIDRRLEEVHETLYTVAGAAVHANIRHDTVAERLKTLEDRVSRLEEKA
jgi:chromosome segregation ATPase